MGSYENANVDQIISLHQSLHRCEAKVKNVLQDCCKFTKDLGHEYVTINQTKLMLAGLIEKMSEKGKGPNDDKEEE